MVPVSALLGQDLNIAPLGSMLQRWDGQLVVAGQGDYVYVVHNRWGEQVDCYIFDISNPNDPKRLETDWRLDESPQRFVMTADGMWGVYNDKITLFSLIDPLLPHSLGTHMINLRLMDVVFGDSIFIQTTFEEGFEIYSSKNPANPERLGAYALPECDKLSLNGDMLAVNRNDSTIILLDITDKANPQLMSEWKTPSMAPDSIRFTDLALGDSILILFYDWSVEPWIEVYGKLAIAVDISNPADPVTSDTVTIHAPEPNPFIHSLPIVYKNSVYLSEAGFGVLGATNSNIIALDCNDPYNVRLSGFGYFQGGANSTLCEYQGYLYFGCNADQYDPHTTWTVYDLADSNQTISQYNGGGRIDNVIVDGDMACVIGTHQFWEVDISNPVEPTVLDSGVCDYWYSKDDDQVQFHNGTTYYLHSGNLYSHKPQLGYLDTLSGVKYNSLVFFDRDYLYSFEEDILTVVNVADPAEMRIVARVPHGCKKIASGLVADSIAYLYTTGEGLSILDMAIPTMPVRIGFVQDVLLYPWRMLLHNQTLMLSSGSAVRLYDVSDPTSPQILSWFDWGDYRYLQTAVGDKVWFQRDGNTWILMDFSNPKRPIEVGHYAVQGYPSGIAIKDSVIYSAEEKHLQFYRWARVHSVSDNNPPLPVTLAISEVYPNPFNSSTRIAYDLPAGGNVNLTVYDLSGREVTRLVEGVMPAGRHSAVWEAGIVPAGIYLIKLTGGSGGTSVKKVVLVK